MYMTCPRDSNKIGIRQSYLYLPLEFAHSLPPIACLHVVLLSPLGKIHESHFEEACFLARHAHVPVTVEKDDVPRTSGSETPFTR